MAARQAYQHESWAVKPLTLTTQLEVIHRLQEARLSKAWRECVALSGELDRVAHGTDLSAYKSHLPPKPLPLDNKPACQERR